MLAFRYPVNTALTVSASLAQIGEFSFILAGLRVSLNLLPIEGQNLILAGALISIALNPDVEIVVRSHSDEEAALLRKERAGQVFLGEHELALGMTRYVLARVAGAIREPGAS